MIIRPATVADLPAIDRIFRVTFDATFAHLYDPADLADFWAGCTAERWRAEYADSGYAFALGTDERGEPLGFAKLGPCKLPHVEPEGTIELRQLYLLKAAHGTGLADALIGWAKGEALRRGASRIALSVWSENWRAQAFYKRHGFEDRGPVTFMVGNHADEDRVWEAAL